MLDIEVHTAFSKDLKKVKLNSTNIAKLFAYISLLLEEKALPPLSKDHALLGEYKDTREFHISGDLVVIYRMTDLTLQLIRIGTHSQLFK